MQQWTYIKPTEPGHYMINRGDVVTLENSYLCDVFLDKQMVLIAKFIDGEQSKVSNIHKCFKWLNVGEIGFELS